MANNVSVKCVGVCRNVKIVVCGIKVGVDLYVLQAKGEGYPIILGRPWLIAMNARQNWEKGTLVLKLGGVTHKYVSVSRGFNRRDFLIPFFTHFLHTEGCHLKGVFTVE